MSLFDGDSADACEAFLACRDHPSKLETRQFLEDVWLRLGHLVGDRPDDFLKQFRRDFHARSWELYLLSVLSAAGAMVEPGQPEGPDLCLRLGGRRVWVEAVVPTPGDPASPDRVFQRPSGAYLGALYPESQLLLRYSSALEAKLRKIESYVSKGIIAPADSALVAVGQGAIVDSDMHDLEVPAIVKAVYPIGEAVIRIPAALAELERVELPPRFSIRKQRGAEVPTTMFVEPRSAAVSGVLFGPQPIWNLPRNSGEGLGLVHNMMARSPMPHGSLPLRCELWVERGELLHRGRCARFVS